MIHDEEGLARLAEENLNHLYGKMFSVAVTCKPDDPHAPWHINAIKKSTGEGITVTDDSLTDAVSRMEEKCQAVIKAQAQADHYHYHY